MSGLAKKVGGAILGLAVVLAWWTFTGGSGSYSESSSLPAQVFGGGGNQLTIEASANQPVEMLAIFFEPSDQRHEQGERAVEKFGPGPKVWAVSMPPGTGGYLELRTPDAKVGTEIEWVLKVNGREIAREKELLEKELGPGYAFFLQYETDDWAQARSREDYNDLEE